MLFQKNTVNDSIPNIRFGANRMLFYLLTLISAQLTFAQSPVLIKDINPGSASGFSPGFSPIPYQNLFLFEGNTANEGRELWRTDGTPDGTFLLRDINPGTAGSLPKGFFEFNGIVYFSATTAQNGIELWRTDGTTDGTFLVKDIYTGTSNSLTALSVVWQKNGLFYFVARSQNANNSELWKSDGTQAGTTILKDINPGTTGSDPLYFKEWNGQLYFRATTATNGDELWKTDGTTAGTLLVKDIYPGTSDSSPTSIGFWEKNGFFFFLAANGSTTNKEIWKSDGTTSGTTLLKEIAPGTVGSNFSGYYEMNGVLYFSADNNNTGNELWKTDGSTAGTTLVKDIYPGPLSSFNSFGLSVFWEKDGSFFFKAMNSSDINIQNLEIWKSDGTAAGTVILRDIKPGVVSSYAQKFNEFEGNLYFSADNDNGYELWKTNGTTSGTVMVKDINPGIYSAFNLGSFNIVWQKDGYFFFGAFSSADISSGNGLDRELWKSDGTTAGTTRVKDIYAGTENGFNSALHSTENTLFFNASSAANGRELWKTDGTTTGTTLVKDIYPGSADGDPQNVFTFYNGFYYLTARNNATTNQEIWRTDGTSAGTTLVMDINPGVSGSIPGSFNILNNRYLMFEATQASTGKELWAFDFPGITSGIHLSKPEITTTLRPNPCHTQLNLDLPFCSGVTTIIGYNTMGMVAFRLETEDQMLTVDTRNLEPGLYNIIIQNGFHRESKKALVVH